MKHLYFVTVYLTDLAYGGAEEGGWYYGCGEREKGRRIFAFDDEDHAEKFCFRYNRRLCKWVNKGRRSISSVLSQGEYTACFYEDKFPPDYYPEERPYYE